MNSKKYSVQLSKHKLQISLQAVTTTYSQKTVEIFSTLMSITPQEKCIIKYMDRKQYSHRARETDSSIILYSYVFCRTMLIQKKN